MQPFRSDIDALEARHAALTAEVADRVRARDEAAQMLAEAKARERDDAHRADLATGGPARRRRYVLLGFVGAFAVGLGILALAHLGHTRRDARERRHAQIVAQFEVFANQTCACQDQACTKRVNDATLAWMSTLPSEARDANPGANWLDKMQTLSQRMGECMVRTLTDGEDR
jgi:hypothetical protein